MNKIILLAIFVTLIGFACSGSQKEKAVTETATNNEVKSEEIVMPSDSGVVKINVTDGKGSVRIQKMEDQTIYIEFPSNGYKKVSGWLSSPDSLANIRFSQIIMPDGTMDGPFGREMDYELLKEGIYRISIHENMMAGDPWAGIFDVKIELKK